MRTKSLPLYTILYKDNMKTTFQIENKAREWDTGQRVILSVKSGSEISQSTEGSVVVIFRIVIQTLLVTDGEQFSKEAAGVGAESPRTAAPGWSARQPPTRTSLSSTLPASGTSWWRNRKQSSFMQL